jgi:hypothetical protein
MTIWPRKGEVTAGEWREMHDEKRYDVLVSKH